MAQKTNMEISAPTGSNEGRPFLPKISRITARPVAFQLVVNGILGINGNRHRL